MLIRRELQRNFQDIGCTMDEIVKTIIKRWRKCNTLTLPRIQHMTWNTRYSEWILLAFSIFFVFTFYSCIAYIHQKFPHSVLWLFVKMNKEYVFISINKYSFILDIIVVYYIIILWLTVFSIAFSTYCNTFDCWLVTLLPCLSLVIVEAQVVLGSGLLIGTLGFKPQHHQTTTAGYWAQLLKHLILAFINFFINIY